MNRRKFVRALGGITLGGTTALAGCSGLDPGYTGGSEGGDTVTATVGAKELWMGHKREGREPGSTSVIHFGPEGAWIDERIEPRIDADSEDIEVGDSLYDLPISEIFTELDGIRTWIVFGLDISTPDEINGNEQVDDDSEYYWYAAPTAFFDHVDVKSEHTFRVATPGEYYDGAGHGRIIDIVD
ncbi:hypothetical protein [Natronomonas amylolytica]|uniref:hypothetical protein n=1 Tax=Natronomonas amylolytica TaxID=3108498 RepID=UPI00300A91FA